MFNMIVIRYINFDNEMSSLEYYFLENIEDSSFETQIYDKFSLCETIFPVIEYFH